MAAFNPFSALVGGLLIGVASVLLLAANGRIAGVSGILHDLVRSMGRRSGGDVIGRAMFIAGLVLAGVVILAVAPQIASTTPVASLGTVALAGLLVGIGTRMANGCTSGHGVCGLGRMSARSFVAVIVFIATGMLTTFLVRHVLEVQL